MDVWIVFLRDPDSCVTQYVASTEEKAEQWTKAHEHGAKAFRFWDIEQWTINK